MLRSRSPLRLYLTVLFVAAGLLAILGAAPGRHRATPAAPLSPVAVPDLTGHWQGTWEDTIYFVQGDVSMDVTVDGNDWNATGSIDLTSIGWPGIGVMTGSASGTLSGNTLTFTFSADSVGDGEGTLVDGNGSGTGSVTAPMSFGAFTFTGTVTASEITGTFDFTSPSGGEGNVSLTRAVAYEDASWSELKASWR